jgi:hypothetical protein
MNIKANKSILFVIILVLALSACKAPAASPTDVPATDISATDLPTLPEFRSGEGTDPVKMIIFNQSDEVLSLFWVDFDGIEQAWGEVPTRTGIPQETLSTHAWRLRSSGGDVVAEFNLTADPLQVYRIAPDLTWTMLTSLDLDQLSVSCFGTGVTDEAWGKISSENGQLFMTVNPPDTIYVPCMEMAFTDFTWEADATLVNTDGTHNDTNFGLLFRINLETHQHYEFVVSTNGYAIVYFNDGTQDNKLTEWVDIGPFDAGAKVHLKVVAAGDQFTVYMNDKLITTVTDASLPTGYVGFVIASTDTTQQQVIFENALVTETK